jgi:hypothetical protein
MMNLAAVNRGSEDIGIKAVVVAELKLPRRTAAYTSC